MTPDNAGLRFELLGPPAIWREGRRLSLSSGKGQAILFYLALNRRPQPRPALAHLLWSEMPDRKARTNLRVTLSKLRPAVGDWLQIDRETVAWRPGAALWTDVAAFEATCAEEHVEAWQAAVALYRGEFLHHFTVPAAPAFAEWVLLEQQRLHHRLQETLQRLVTRALAAPALAEEGIHYARRLLALDPWREEAHRHLMQLLARSGRRGAALAQFESCRRILAEEFGVEPSAETHALHEAIRDGGESALPVAAPASPRPEPPLPPHNLPAATTPFVGREEDLARVGALLADPACRLLTLAGPGGSGKTRLGLTAARRARATLAADFADGVLLVRLAAAGGRAELLNAVAQATDLTLQGTDPPAQQVTAHLGPRRMLLLLDNFEQLVAHAPLLAEWLAAAPGLSLLVTSRERLHLYEEWVLDVPGLAVPGPEWDAAADEGAKALQQYAGVQLFVARARRVNLRFDPAAEAEGVAAICRLTGGLPLALELAAAWVRNFACAEIAAELRQNLDLLATRARNRPARHQSIEATFTYSWRMLHEQERAVLGRLALFAGGFSLAAAQAVAGATPRLLAQLVDKSLVQRQPDGRYQMHELLRHFAAAGTEPPAGAHARYFAGLLAAHSAALRGPEPEAAVAQLLPDLDNLRLAWHRLIAAEAWPALEGALLALFELYDARSWYVEGERLLAAAAAARGRPLLAARLAAFRARFLTRQGRLAEAEALVRESLDRLEGQDPREYGDALNNLNNILRRSGRYAEAREALDEAQAVYEAAGFRRGVASVLNNRGLAAYREGDYETAAALQQRSAGLYRQTGPRKDLATVLNNLGLSRLYRGEYAAAADALRESAATADAIGYHGCLVVATQNLGLVALRREAWEEAETYLVRSLRLAQELGVQDMAGHAHHDLAVFYLQRGRLALAREHGEAALALGRELGMQWLIASTQGNLGALALAEGDLAGAETRLRAGLALAQEVAAHSVQLEILLGWASLLAARGAPGRALQIVTAVRAELGEDPALRERAAALFAELAAALPAGEPAARRAAAGETVAALVARLAAET